jgi:hypothetical protein
MMQVAKVVVRLLVSCVASNPIQNSRDSSATKSPHSPSPRAYLKVLPVLSKKTSVPWRLPTQGLGLETEDDVFAIVKSADDTTYIVILAATPDCEGQHVCSYGTLIGTSCPLNEIDVYGLTDRRGIPVHLRHGLKGLFYQSICGAYCSGSLVVWTEGKYHYIIGLKAGNKRDMIVSANSAIGRGSSLGPRPQPQPATAQTPHSKPSFRVP